MKSRLLLLLLLFSRLFLLTCPSRRIPCGCGRGRLTVNVQRKKYGRPLFCSNRPVCQPDELVGNGEAAAEARQLGMTTTIRQVTTRNRPYQSIVCNQEAVHQKPISITSCDVRRRLRLPMARHGSSSGRPVPFCAISLLSDPLFPSAESALKRLNPFEKMRKVKRFRQIFISSQFTDLLTVLFCRQCRHDDHVRKPISPFLSQTM